MNILDENFPEDQIPKLRTWGIPVRQIGRELSRPGVKDTDIIPLLHRLRHATFLTQDKDFFKQALCHLLYCIAYLDVPADDAARYVRRFFRHARFDIEVKLMGIVARAHHNSIHFWHRHHFELQEVEWLYIA